MTQTSPPHLTRRLALTLIGCALGGAGAFGGWHFWGPDGVTALQLRFLPQILAVGTWFVAWAVALSIALVLVIRVSGPLSKVARPIVRLASVVVAAVASLMLVLYSFVAAIFSDGTTTTVDGQKYGVSTPFLGSADDACYHEVINPVLMERSCIEGLVPDSRRPVPGVQASAPPSNPVPASEGEMPAVGEAWEQPVTGDQIIASHGNVGIAQVASSLGQKGTYVAATGEGDTWTASTVIADGVSFMSLEGAGGILIAAFSPHPEAFLLVSVDNGITWQAAQFPEGGPWEEQAFFHGVEFFGGTYLLSTGYPPWVDSADVMTWESFDGLAWTPAN